jgi:hypothetical protein
MPDVGLPTTSEDEALARIISALRSPRRTDPVSHPTYGYDLYVPNIVYDRLQEIPKQGAGMYRYDTRTGAEPFYAAARNLCLRGILSPGPVHPNPQGANPIVAGGGFNLTSYGRKWLQETHGFEAVPAEYGRFAQILAGHSVRFGDGYHTRSQEATRCYQAHTYLACCAMCGAAAESILLTLAIAKTGAEEKVIREYQSSNGRSKVEKIVAGQLKAHLQQDFASYMGLLKYWRDSAAHGISLVLDEEGAFTSLILLLRFAQFSDRHWKDLTAAPVGPGDPPSA